MPLRHVEQRRDNLYALAEHWLGEPGIDEAAIVHLVRRYLAGFWPGDPGGYRELDRATGIRPESALEAIDLGSSVMRTAVG